MHSAILHQVSGQALEILTNNRNNLYKAANHLPEAATLSEPGLRTLTQGLRRLANATLKVAMNE